ncbi:MAG: porin family protein [Methylobacteriaceae bacterium]|jgi:outer membrane immunogenic protein|nr:porin family protein [Methylobacteriaceae bacterium]
MKKFTMRIALLSAASFLASTAFAADLPSNTLYSQPQSYASPGTFSWTGFYAGLNLGYGWPKVDHDVYEAGSVNFPRLSKSEDGSFIFGLTAGYNYQVDPQFVVGAEGDLNFSKLKVSGGTIVPFAAGLNYQVSTKIDWYGTLRGRIGFLPSDRLMIYGTGGLAFADVDTGGVSTIVASGVAHTNKVTDSGVRFGWTLGLGAEYAITPNVTAKLAYDYVDVADDTAYFNSGGSRFVVKDDPSFQTIRLGVNYKF